MSIENNLKRIADAAERIATALEALGNDAPSVDTAGNSSAETTVAPSPVAPSAPASTTPPAPVETASAPSTPAAPSAPVQETPAPSAPTAVPPVNTMTVEELNGLLVAEYQRLGENRGPIDEALKAHGVDSVLNLKPEQYQSVLDQVRAVQS